MIPIELDVTINPDTEDKFADLVESLIERLHEGDNVPIEQLVAEHPKYADRLRAVCPALEVMARLKKSRSFSSGNRSEDTRHEMPLRQTIGDFRILRELGRGGMGVVYEAEQVSMARHVALKMLPFAAIADSKALQRFKNEVRAAATLNHTNIIPIHSIGEDGGIHYYVMQLVRGQTLAEVINDLRKLRQDHVDLDGSSIVEVISSHSSEDSSSGVDATLGYGDADQDTTPKATLSTTGGSHTGKEFFRSVATLGVRAADALDHAHQRGVLHRDIKPGNLMLDAEAHLYVTDFGLARIQSDAGLTMTGDLLGTLRYMSPEQALAKRIVVDHRSDNYSLGATLYELLTLEPAITGNDRQEVLRRIAFNEPIKPRRINRAIPAELETIVLKALAKNPDDRYLSAHDLAADFQRYLDDQPIQAKPLNLAQHAARWSRRHKTAVVGIVAMLVLASAGLAISNLLIGQERDVARQQRDEAQRQSKRADENFRRAKAAVDEYLTKISENELLDVPTMQPLRKELFESALVYYEEFIKESSDAPELQAELAAAHFRIGQITAEISSVTLAVESHRRALEIRKQLVADRPNIAAYRLDLINSCHTLGSHYLSIGDYADANELLSLAMRSCAELKSQIPADQHLATLAKSHQGLGQLHALKGDVAAAKTSYGEAIAIQEQLVAEGMTSHRKELGKSYVALTKLLLDNNLVRHSRLDPDALASSEASIDICDKLLLENPASIKRRHELAAAYNLHCLVQMHEGTATDAVASGQRCVELLTPLVDENPGLINEQSLVAAALHNIGSAQQDLGHLAEALVSYRLAVETEKQIVRTQPAVIKHQHFLGNHTLKFSTYW